MLRELGAFFLYSTFALIYILSKNHCVAILIEYFAKQTMRGSAQ